MAYEKLNLQNGTKFTAAHVAHLEQGITDMAGIRRLRVWTTIRQRKRQRCWPL